MMWCPESSTDLDHAEEARWVERAAVLSWFDPVLVGAPEDEDELLDSEGWNLLLCQSEVVRIQGYDRRRLNLATRRNALRALDSRERMAQALGETPVARRPRDRVQLAIDILLADSPIDLAGSSLDALYGFETVLGWFEGLLEGLPPAEAILAARYRKELLSPHEALAGRNFYGRRVERERLRSYINELRNERRLARIIGHLHGLARWWNDYPPLVVHGPPGVGKSSLIANFVLEHAAIDGFVFIDLDFGRPNIDSRSPETLLAEAARQIGAQVPGQLAEGERVASNIETMSKPVEQPDFLESVVVAELSHSVAAFVHFAESVLPAQNIPFVLDTFEEATALGSTHTNSVLELTAQLQQQLPRLRPVVCSRVRPYESSAWLDILIPGMEPTAAAEYLAVQLDRRGLSEMPAELIPLVVKRVNGTPLALNIAVELLCQAREQGRDLMAEVATISSKASEAYLFDRLLKQIDVDDAKRLAFPGLIVRRLEPRLVLDVLKQPCGLTVTTEEQALNLLEVLAAKVSLIQRQWDTVFIHRPDVRRLMLKNLIENVPAETIRKIDEAAIVYFLAQGTEEATAEAAYHRLRVGALDKADALLADPKVADHLRLAVDEFEPDARLILCRRLGITPSEEDLKAASDYEWVRAARVTAGELLSRGAYQQAVDIVAGRTELRNAELDRIVAEACVGLGDWSAARISAERGLALARQSGEASQEIRLALTLARIGFGQDDFALAGQALDAIKDVESEAASIDLRVHVAVAKLRLARVTGDEAATRQAAQLTADLISRDALGHILPSTLRELTGELLYIRRADPHLADGILVTALQRLGFEHAAGAGATTLADLLHQASRGEGADANAVARLIAATTETRPPTADAEAESWSDWLASVSALGLGQLLAGILRLAEGPLRLALVSLIVAQLGDNARHARERKLLTS